MELIENIKDGWDEASYIQRGLLLISSPLMVVLIPVFAFMYMCGFLASAITRTRY